MKKDWFHAIFTYILKQNKLLMITLSLKMFNKDGELFIMMLSALERIILKSVLSSLLNKS